MNIEKYLETLRGKNGTCRCKSLSALYKSEEVANKTKGYERDIAIARFYEQLESLSATNLVGFRLHKPNRIERITESRAKKLLEHVSPAPIISIHCLSCNQQIAIAV